MKAKRTKIIGIFIVLVFMNFQFLFLNSSFVSMETQIEEKLEFMLSTTLKTNDCDNDINFNAKITHEIIEKKFGIDENYYWLDNINWSEYGSSLMKEIQVDNSKVEENIANILNYPFQFLFSCIDFDRYILTLLELTFIYPSIHYFDKLTESQDVEKILKELGLETSVYKLDIAIEPIIITGTATDYNGSKTIRMGETFRLLGDLTEKYKFNGTVFSPNLDVDIIQHFEYKNDNLIGVSLNGSVIGVLNDVFINRTLSLNYKQDNVEYMLLDERDSIIIFLSNIRIFLFQYTLLVILMVLSLLLVIIIYIRKKRKRGN